MALSLLFCEQTGSWSFVGPGSFGRPARTVFLAADYYQAKINNRQLSANFAKN